MRMTIIVCWVIGFIIAASGLFYVTLQVEALEDKLVNLNRQIIKEQENIHMLQAEWSYFNRPDRIQKLTENLLPQMQPVEARQFVSFQTLPFRIEDEKVTPSSATVTNTTQATSISHNGGTE
ncbi:cell division protein FtsL [Curvivirga aplysinae]|uniref:cell division protein FtsL n=1 Tax=Curvivirga aplysinae TaxID=2529852 RepID=UPI0012BB69A2|nr:hypothetical protein [Curvivirga aplysinae]MTI10788.1 hypothetical protein [Curvivirga aplysinae]